MITNSNQKSKVLITDSMMRRTEWRIRDCLSRISWDGKVQYNFLDISKHLSARSALVIFKTPLDSLHSRCTSSRPLRRWRSRTRSPRNCKKIQWWSVEPTRWSFDLYIFHPHEELDEVFLVSLSHAVVDPGTVVIHPPGKKTIVGHKKKGKKHLLRNQLDAMLTDPTMVSSWRPIHLAPGFHFISQDLDVSSGSKNPKRKTWYILSSLLSGQCFPPRCGCPRSRFWTKISLVLISIINIFQRQNSFTCAWAAGRCLGRWTPPCHGRGTAGISPLNRRLG